MEIYMNELKTEIYYELPKNMKFIQELDHGSFGKVILVRESNKNTGTRVREIDFKDDPLVSAAIKEGVFILKINEKDFDSVSEKIQI